MKLLKLLTSIADKSERFPERIAVITDSKEWTYHQLWDLVHETDKKLKNINLPAQSSIAVTANKSVATLALMMALGQRGHTPLAVSPDLGHLVKPVMFKNAAVYCELNAVMKDGVPNLGTTFMPEHQSNVFHNTLDIADSPLMLTTSGSTGIPKVVILDSDGINAFFDWAEHFFDIGSESRVLSYAPLNFDLSLLEVWAPLSLGGTVIFTNHEKSTQANYLQSLIRETKPNIIQGVPMLYTLLSEGFDTSDSPLLEAKHVIFTGDITPLILRQKVVGIFPKAFFHNVYGCTETNDSFVHTSLASTVIKYERLPIGSPIKGTIYRIFNDSGETVHASGEGELHTSTPFLAHGYTDTEQNTTAFYWDEFEQRRYYKTGDRVSIDENGEINLLGRSDYIVKVRGVRTNLQDIEQTIKLSEQVQEVVVVPVSDDLAGVILHAIVELKVGNKFDGLALRTHCAERLPLTSVPRRFHVQERPIPRTTTGKPDRKKLFQFIQRKEMQHDTHR